MPSSSRPSDGQQPLWRSTSTSSSASGKHHTSSSSSNSAGSVAHEVTSEILDRSPPKSEEAERGVLGSMLLDGEMCDEVILQLDAHEFYSPSHQKLYGHLVALHEDGFRTDDTTLLLERLRKAGDLEAVGGATGLYELIHSVPHAANAIHYAKIVQEKATLRVLLQSCQEILRECYDQFLDTRDLLSRAEQRIFSILEEKGTTEVSRWEEVLQEAFARIDERLKQGSDLSGLRTGFTEFDRMTGGLHPAELVIVAGRPSMGKTALACNIAENVAFDQKVGTLFVSLEMSRNELAERMLCSYARVNAHKLRNGFLPAEGHAKLVEKASTISKSPLYIDDTPSRTLTEIAASARRLKRREGLGLIIIDYLQLIEPDNPRDPRQEQVAKIARRLKGLARSLEVPVCCLAQLNRQAETTKDNRPRLSHLRESGAIEQDADLVTFVHREEYYATNEQEREELAGKAELILAKQRNGPVGDVRLTFQAEFARFANPADEDNLDFGTYGGEDVEDLFND